MEAELEPTPELPYVQGQATRSSALKECRSPVVQCPSLRDGAMRRSSCSTMFDSYPFFIGEKNIVRSFVCFVHSALAMWPAPTQMPRRPPPSGAFTSRKKAPTHASRAAPGLSLSLRNAEFRISPMVVFSAARQPCPALCADCASRSAIRRSRSAILPNAS